MQLQIFENNEFGKIRTTVDASGRILFCGSDVARALGYQEPHKAIRRHTKDKMQPAFGDFCVLAVIDSPRQV